MAEKGVDVIRSRAEHSVKANTKAKTELHIDPIRFEERRERSWELVGRLLDDDVSARATARVEIRSWFNTQIGPDGPKNVNELRLALEGDNYGGVDLDEARRNNYAEIYYACVGAEVAAVQVGLGEDWESTLIRDAAVNLQHKVDWNDAAKVASAFDSVFGSDVLVGGAVAVSQNILTDKNIIRQLALLEEELAANYGSREIGGRLEKLERLDESGDIKQSGEYKMARRYLLALRADALRHEKSERYSGGMRRKIQPVGAEGGADGPGAGEMEAGMYDLEFPDFVETAIKMEQVPWRIENRPEWYKQASVERKRFFDTTRRLTDGASWMKFYQNKDLEKCWQNPSYLYSGKEMNSLMNADFKRVSMWMLRDLGVFEITADGVERFVYKAGEGGIGIDKGVLDKIANLDNYMESLATKLARERRFAGMDRREAKELEAAKPTRATEMDKLIASNSWNMFYTTYGSSLADVDRVLAPNERKLSDKIRTLNAEAKARKKLQLFNMAKNVEMVGENGSLITAEWFGGGVAAWVEMVLAIEEETGKPLDGNKTLREKIRDKDMWFFDTPLIYSFYDTKEVEVVTGKEKGRGGKPIKETMTIGRALYEGVDFKFDDNENDVMSDFRDETEAAVRTWTVLMGKSQMKGAGTLVSELRSSVGLLSQIALKGKLPGRISTIVKTPEFWAMSMINTFGPDLDVLTSEGIYLKGAISNASYGSYVQRRYDQFQLQPFVNPAKFKKFLRADAGIWGRTQDTIKGLLRNQTVEQVYRQKWARVENQYELQRIEAVRFASEEQRQLLKWRNTALENGDMEAVTRFDKLISGEVKVTAPRA
jgi:hypothetical protein